MSVYQMLELEALKWGPHLFVEVTTSSRFVSRVDNVMRRPFLTMCIVYALLS